jgi:hypothetical protein
MTDENSVYLSVRGPGVSPAMEKELIDRAEAIRVGILQLRDSL